ncbi:MAG: haloacid dehalogenase type II [Thermoleophilia bacterium]
MAQLAFDVYGTLVDPASFADALAGRVPHADALAGAWRRHQLEISWLLTAAGRYEPWPTVTGHALDAAMDEAGLPRLAADERDAVLELAALPRPYPDALPALEALRDEGHALAVLSNGTSAGLSRLLEHVGLASAFGAVVSVDEIDRYKPAPEVYAHCAARLGRAPCEVWLVSGNPFDAAGAALAGLRVAKVERARTHRYGFAPAPDLVVTSLADLPAALRAAA